jgi:hypothetical protein
MAVVSEPLNRLNDTSMTGVAPVQGHSQQVHHASIEFMLIDAQAENTPVVTV